jgi:nitrate/nitrite-specific signal transduction histidine kinase
MKVFRKTVTDKYFWAILSRWRWQWLGLAILTGTTLALAIVDGFVPFNLDLVLLIMYGLLLPFCTIWMISALARSQAERARSEEDLAKLQSFIQQLEHCQDHRELTSFILKYAATLLPINHVSLFIYDHRNAQLQFTGEWNSDGRQSLAVDRYLASVNICHACLIKKSPQLRHTGACVAMLGLPGNEQAAEYCQPLIYDNLLVGILRLQCKPGMTFAQDRIAFLQLIAPEMALALALSLAQPQQLTQAQMEARITERRSLAYDLHNSLAQQASYLHLTLERMLHERNVVMADDVRQDLLQMRDAALDMYEEIRTDLAQLRLHPTADLLSAVAAHTRSVADQTGLTIQVTTHGEPVAILPPVTQQIVGLLREGLTNIQRHAQARSALIALTWLPEILMIVLSDDGAGFDPQDVPEGHYGLIMMAERTADLGGELHINSERGNGTCLTFRFSLPVLQSGKPIWPARLIQQYEEP